MSEDVKQGKTQDLTSWPFRKTCTRGKAKYMPFEGGEPFHKGITMSCNSIGQLWLLDLEEIV